MSDNKSVDAMANMGAHFKEDMDKLQQQAPASNDLYEDILNEDEEVTEEAQTEEVEDPRDTPVKFTPDEEGSYDEVYNEPSEEEVASAEENFPGIEDVDEPLFFGGPLQSEIASWKKQFKGQSVFITQAGGEYFIIRTLNRYEYKQIVSIPNTDPLMREEIFCHTCVLWPRPYDWKSMASGKAGIPSTLATIIMEQSGFVKNYDLEVL